MDLWLILVATVLGILSSANLQHFLRKRRVAYRKEHVFFIEIFLLFLASGILHVFRGITDWDTYSYSLAISIAVTFAIFAAGLALAEQLLPARFTAPTGIVFAAISLLGNTLGIYAQWGIQELTYLLAIVGVAVCSNFTILILAYYFGKTRLSALFGLLIGILLPTILGIAGIADTLVLVATSALVNLIMLLGFKGKRAFLGLSDEEKERRGLPRRVAPVN